MKINLVKDGIAFLFMGGVIAFFIAAIINSRRQEDTGKKVQDKDKEKIR